MVHYKTHKSVNTWIVGVVVFVLAMTITFADVYGLSQFDFNKPSQSGTSGSSGTTTPSGDWTIDPNSADDPFPESPIPTNTPEPGPGVPEPATLTLLGLGLGALIVRRKGN